MCVCVFELSNRVIKRLLSHVTKYVVLMQRHIRLFMVLLLVCDFVVRRRELQIHFSERPNFLSSLIVCSTLFSVQLWFSHCRSLKRRAQNECMESVKWSGMQNRLSFFKSLHWKRVCERTFSATKQHDKVSLICGNRKFYYFPCSLWSEKVCCCVFYWPDPFFFSRLLLKHKWMVKSFLFINRLNPISHKCASTFHHFILFAGTVCYKLDHIGVFATENHKNSTKKMNGISSQFTFICRRCSVTYIFVCLLIDAVSAE